MQLWQMLLCALLDQRGHACSLSQNSIAIIHCYLALVYETFLAYVSSALQLLYLQIQSISLSKVSYCYIYRGFLSVVPLRRPFLC